MAWLQLNKREIKQPATFGKPHATLATSKPHANELSHENDKGRQTIYGKFSKWPMVRMVYTCMVRIIRGRIVDGSKV